MWGPIRAAGGEGAVGLEPPALSPMETPPPRAQNQTLRPGRGTAAAFSLSLKVGRETGKIQGTDETRFLEGK